MSQTKRNISGDFSKNSTNPEKYWDPGFIDRVRNGLVAMPKAYVCKSGDNSIDEVWSQKAKKFAKRQRNRALRRKNKKIDF